MNPLKTAVLVLLVASAALAVIVGSWELPDHLTPSAAALHEVPATQRFPDADEVRTRALPQQPEPSRR